MNERKPLSIQTPLSLNWLAGDLLGVAEQMDLTPSQRATLRQLALDAQQMAVRLREAVWLANGEMTPQEFFKLNKE